MELKGLGNVEQLNSKIEKQSDGSEGNFNELFAALFYNMQLAVNSNPGNAEDQTANITNASEFQVSVINNLESLTNQMNLINDFIEPSKNGINIEAKLDELLKSNTANIQDIIKLLNKHNLKDSKVDETSKLFQIITENMNKATDNKQTNQNSVSFNEQSLGNSAENIKTELIGLGNQKLDKSLNMKVVEKSKFQEKGKEFNSLYSNNSEEKFKSTNIKENPQNIQTGFYDIFNTKSDIKVEAKDIVNIAKPEDIVEVIVDRFKSMRLPGTTEIKVKLRPEELGEITIKVILEKGQINGSIHADRREIVNMLQSQIDNLKQDLKNNNVNLNNISVNVSSDSNYDGSQQRYFSQDQRRGNRRFIEYTEDSQTDVNKEDGFNMVV